ncbi:hypothetical protein O6H91_07G088900 [Diphasiastrum complanatum]|uniref:Uncharacterized protein n=1 Tax=Diphasiastrum complanatum TaxID=34168 RepID=A0ACC2D7L3_DIPCM|nr:hypothetical protein O6H91_07G088900 [Diphasiastrum complanatum]
MIGCSNWVKECKVVVFAFHNVTAMVGAGVLSLPSAMGTRSSCVVLSWVITLYTLWQMVQMHEMVEGKRFEPVRFAPKFLHAGVQASLQACVKKSHWILNLDQSHFFLAQLPNFNSISGLSLAAAVMSLSYPHQSTAGAIFHVFNALGQVAFAYAGHNVVLEIQATIPSTPEKPSKTPMWRGVIVAYIVVAICYFPVAFVGYWAFGNDRLFDNVLTRLQHPTWLVATANLMVVIHVIGSYQVYAMPVFDMLETVFVKKMRLSPGLLLRLIVRSTYVALTCFIAITLPFFGDLLGFFWRVCFRPNHLFYTSFADDDRLVLQLPCIMWLAIYKPSYSVYPG